jgi:uncharacterized protein (DUF1330 family)
MSAYILAAIDKHDPMVCERHRAVALTVVARYGGRSLLQGTQYARHPLGDDNRMLYDRSDDLVFETWCDPG